jgi:hypothetical protein
LAAIQDARQVSSRAASICVAISASGKAMPWLSMIGPPNASRCQVVLCGGRRQVERHERSPGSVDLSLPPADGFNPAAATATDQAAERGPTWRMGR